ncbi:MAG: peptide MFS transporter [Gammaproteobacteria bacterium]|nr:peptide MFS transporter [Gammaproteobacteria bacterium]
MNQSTSVTDTSFFGHPKGLMILFLTEMWERFSYYGMRALLIFYLTQHFLFGREKAYLIYGAYTALVYVAPVIGGLLADKYLGSRKAVVFGAILLVAGHFGMAFEGPTAVASATGEVVRNPLYLNIFYLSLALIISGVGFLKANISTIVGALYEKGDRRRDAGFTLFYMGINLGAAAGAILAGWLGQTYGWKYGFGLAGIGMLAGLVVFLKGQPLLMGRADPPDTQKLVAKSPIGLSNEWTIYIGTLLGVVVIWKLIQYQELVGTLLGIFGLAVVIGILVFSFTKCTKEERDQMIMALMLMIFSILFWALFEQAGSSLNLYTDEAVNRTIFGIDVPASVFQSINAIYIVIFGPVFAALWLYLGKRDKEPSIPAKFGMGLILLGLGFLVLVWGANGADGLKTPVIFIFLIYLLHTFGELCMSPVGLSAVTKLSVPRVVGLMMGTWFLASATGNFAASMIARMTAGVDGEVSDPAKVLEVYNQVGLMSIGAGIAILILTPLVFKRLMHGVR